MIAATTRMHKQSALAPKGRPSPMNNKEHRSILQVNTSDPAAMNLAPNNATNVAQYYRDRGENVKIEVVMLGPGLHMLRTLRQRRLVSR
jgi:hypothetical protein